MFSKILTKKFTMTYFEQIEALRSAFAQADAVVIGAGSGLSTAAGLSYTGKRFQELFPDFIQAFGLRDMYSAGFYPYPDLESFWAYWSRHIMANRYEREVGQPYHDLLKLVEDKDYFVLTTNVDHCFQDAGFDQKRLFYTQGDYGLFQCSRGCHPVTYDNEKTVRKMVAQQRNLKIPTELIPHCPRCGRPMSMNLRVDDTFVEDEGWHRSAGRYANFLHHHEGMHILFLELGVGENTPVIIKYPFWNMTKQNPNATYACLNLGEAIAPEEIAQQSICIDAGIGAILKDMSLTTGIPPL